MSVGMTVQTTSATLLPWVWAGSVVVARLAPVAEDRPDDQALDDEEDHDRDQEDDRVQLADLAPWLVTASGGYRLLTTRSTARADRRR